MKMISQNKDDLDLLDALTPDQQETLSSILEKYLADLESGHRRDPDELMAANPDLADALSAYLSSLDFLHGAVANLDGESGDQNPGKMAYDAIGDFKIVREIGRGGMGIVYEARQISLGRQVALKVLPFAAVLDQKQIARFKNEAQAAAQLNHPHIVPVHSVGVDRGVHYYSMQFIDGQSLDHAIAQLKSWTSPVTASGESNAAAEASTVALHSFSTARSFRTRTHVRSIAELAVQAADAIQHAHEFGIVHRDIKPSNLMVDLQGKLWVTDFGLARFAEGNNITMTGDLLGTVRYMSPEQAAGRSNLVDHRSDVFSLGVTLYELLTLRLPLDAPDRQSLLNKIQFEEPDPPRKINPSIPIDLETIVLKAISKSRDDRYESAAAFAEDLRRYLSGKPTLARRPTAVDRMAKWAGRHRAFVFAATAVTFMALLGTATAAWMLNDEKQRTAAALAVAQTNLQQSQANLGQSIDVVDRFALRIVNELRRIPGAESIRQNLLTETIDDYKTFARQLEDNAEMRFALALCHSQIASLHGQLGQLDNAKTEYNNAIALFQQIGEQPNESNVKLQLDLAVCKNNLGDILFQLGDTASAETTYADALSLSQSLNNVAPGVPAHQQVLAAILVNQGNLQRSMRQTDVAMKTYDQAIEIQSQLSQSDPDNHQYQRELAVSFAQLSFLHAAADLGKADRFNQRAIAIHQSLVQSDPNALQPLSDLATSYNHRGAIFSAGKKIDDAIDAFRLAIEVQERLVLRAPTVVRFQEELAVGNNNLGQMLVMISPTQARERFRTSRDQLEKLVAVSPNSPNYRAQLGGVLANLAPMIESDQYDEARVAYQQAIEHQQWAVEHAPEIVDFRVWLSSSYVKFGRFLRKHNDPLAAGDLAIERRKLWKGNGKHLRKVAAELAQTAAMLEADNHDEVDAWIAEAVETLRQAINAGADREEIQNEQVFAVLKQHPDFPK